MKRTILIFLIVLSSALTSFAQAKAKTETPKCTLSLDRAPQLRGLGLGAPLATVLARFPGVSVGKPDKFGVSQLRLVVIETPPAAKGLPGRDKGVQPDVAGLATEENSFYVDVAKFPDLKRVRKIHLRFIDGRLANVRVAYDDSIRWDDLDEFIDSVANALNLPSAWTKPDMEGDSAEKELRCDGFVITASVGSDSTDTHVAAQLTLEDLAAAKVLQNRLNEVKEKAWRDDIEKKKNFKP